MNAVDTERGRVDVAVAVVVVVDDEEESRRNAARRKQYLLSRWSRLAKTIVFVGTAYMGRLYCSHVFSSLLLLPL